MIGLQCQHPKVFSDEGSFPWKAIGMVKPLLAMESACGQDRLGVTSVSPFANNGLEKRAKICLIPELRATKHHPFVFLPWNVFPFVSSKKITEWWKSTRQQTTDSMGCNCQSVSYRNGTIIVVPLQKCSLCSLYKGILFSAVQGKVFFSYLKPI